MFKKTKIFEICGTEYHQDLPESELRDLFVKIRAREKKVAAELQRLEEESRALGDAVVRMEGWLARRAPTSFFCFTCTAKHWFECECECSSCYELAPECTCSKVGDGDF